MGRRRKRRREVEEGEGEGGEDGASWEGVRSGGGGVDEDGEGVHYLLPLKAGGKLVLQPPVPISNGTYVYSEPLRKGHLWNIKCPLYAGMGHNQVYYIERAFLFSFF